MGLAQDTFQLIIQKFVFKGIFNLICAVCNSTLNLKTFQLSMVVSNM